MINFNKEILSIEIQECIKNNINSNISELILKGLPFSSEISSEIINQIEAKNRCKNKLNTWFETDNIYYPNKLNIEQTSSEVTAKHKASLINGSRLIDVTGGFGVDCFYFAKQFETVTHCELNTDLSKIVAHNNSVFNIENIDCIADNGIEHIINNETAYDWIYAFFPTTLKLGTSLTSTFSGYSLARCGSSSTYCPKCQNSFKSPSFLPFALSFPKDT